MPSRAADASKASMQRRIWAGDSSGPEQVERVAHMQLVVAFRIGRHRLQ